MQRILRRIAGTLTGLLLLTGLVGCTAAEKEPAPTEPAETVSRSPAWQAPETAPEETALSETAPEENRIWREYVNISERVTEDPAWASYIAGEDRFAPFAPDSVWNGYILTTEQPAGWQEMQDPDGTITWVPAFQLYHVPEGGAVFTEELAETIAGNAYDAYLLGDVLCEVQQWSAEQLTYYFYIPLDDSTVLRLDLSADTLTMEEQYTLVKNLSLTPTEYREVENEYGIVYRTDGGVRIEPAEGESVTLRFTDPVSVQWTEKDAVLCRVFAGCSRYEMLVNLQTGEKTDCYQETGALLRDMGLTAEETLSLRYEASFQEGEVHILTEAVTRQEHIFRITVNGQETLLRRTPLLQTEKPTAEEIPERFRTMLRYVNHSLAIQETAQKHTIVQGNSLYFRNDRYGINTPAALEYVFSCFLTRADTQTLLAAENHAGDRWWQENEQGYLYISSVSSGLDALYGAELTVTENPDGTFTAAAGERTFRYVEEEGHWCWQLFPDAEDSVQAETTAPEETVPGEPAVIAPETLSAAAILTDQLVMRVMSPDWLTPGYTVTDRDLHWFLVTMDLYMDEPLYPWSDEMTLRRDGTNEYCTISGDTARRAVRELFGCDVTSPDAAYSLPETEDIYDAGEDIYRMIQGTGRNTTAYWYENMDVTASGDAVFADADLVSARWFEWEEMYYGRYRFTYRTVSEEDRTFLRLAGVERLYSGYREDCAPEETADFLAYYDAAMSVYQWFYWGCDRIGHGEEQVRLGNAPYYRVEDPTFRALGIGTVADLRTYLQNFFTASYTDTLLSGETFLDIDGSLHVVGASRGGGARWEEREFCLVSVSDTQKNLVCRAAYYPIGSMEPEEELQEYVFPFVWEQGKWLLDDWPKMLVVRVPRS